MNEMKITWRFEGVWVTKGDVAFMRLAEEYWIRRVGESWEQCYEANEELEKEYLSIGKEEPDCEHDLFKCQVPASDSCVPIYHQVCKKCRWDATKGIIMPDDIWNGWAVRQLEGDKT